MAIVVGIGLSLAPLSVFVEPVDQTPVADLCFLPQAPLHEFRWSLFPWFSRSRWLKCWASPWMWRVIRSRASCFHCSSSLGSQFRVSAVSSILLSSWMERRLSSQTKVFLLIRTCFLSPSCCPSLSRLAPGGCCLFRISGLGTSEYLLCAFAFLLSSAPSASTDSFRPSRWCQGR